MVREISRLHLNSEFIISDETEIQVSLSPVH